MQQVPRAPQVLQAFQEQSVTQASLVPQDLQELQDQLVLTVPQDQTVTLVSQAVQEVQDFQDPRVPRVALG